METMKQTNIAKQSRSLIYSKMNFTASEQRLILTLIAQINEEDSDLKPIKCTLKDLNEIYGVKLRSDNLKRNLKNINKSFWVKNDKDNWVLYNMFYMIEIEKGSSDIAFTFHPELKEHLLNLVDRVRFGKTNIKNLVHLKSKYSIRLYQILKLHLWETEVAKREFSLDLKELKEMLMTPNSYNNFSKFNEKVLEVAQHEINKYTDINFTYAMQKVGRKVDSISFNIRTDMLKKSRMKHDAKREYDSKFK